MGFGSGFFELSWVRFWIKIHVLYLARGLLRVKTYRPYPHVGLVGSSFFGQVGLNCSNRVAHDQVYYVSVAAPFDPDHVTKMDGYLFNN